MFLKEFYFRNSGLLFLCLHYTFKSKLHVNSTQFPKCWHFESNNS